jgi:hypothetical protein
MHLYSHYSTAFCGYNGERKINGNRTIQHLMKEFTLRGRRWLTMQGDTAYID